MACDEQNWWQCRSWVICAAGCGLCVHSLENRSHNNHQMRVPCKAALLVICLLVLLVASTVLRQAKRLITPVAVKVESFMLLIGRAELRTLTSLLTGHCSLLIIIFIRWVLLHPTNVGFVKKVETAGHILCDCEVITLKQWQVFG